MLRALLVLLLLANLAFLSYTQGWLDGLLGPPDQAQQREPHRLERQINPDKIRLLTPRAAASAIAEAASAPSAPGSEP
ncbi:MAG: hypothetical protein ACKVQR_21340 [Aquabacterium sp.]